VCGIISSLLALTAVAAESPSLVVTTAEADDAPAHEEHVATVSYVARVQEGTELQKMLDGLQPGTALTTSGPFHVHVSGKDVTSIVWDRPIRSEVDYLVLIDVGAPHPGLRPTLSTAMASAVQALAAAHLPSASEAVARWRFRFIAGDEKLCRLSTDLPVADLATDPARVLASRVKDMKSENLPFAEERMAEMIPLFDGNPMDASGLATPSHVLLVVADAPPVWFPRETTEWLTRDGSSVPTRKLRGFAVQTQVRAGDTPTANRLAELVAAGHAIPLIIASAGGGPRSSQLHAGVDEVFARVALPKLTDFTAPPVHRIVEYQGTLRVPLTHVQRPAVGAYEVEVEMIAAKEHAASHATPIVERALHSWLSQQLVVYHRVIVGSGAVLIALLILASVLSWVGVVDPEFAQEARNATFVFAGLAFGLAAGLVGDGYQRYSVSGEAVFIGVSLALLGFVLWLAHHAYVLAKRELDLVFGK
jgi:hypothetical protein